MLREADVLVVGAGPAGASCATILAREGLRVLLIDRAGFPREKTCGCCINPSCWPLFEQLGVAGDLAGAPSVRIGRIRIMTASGSTTTRPIPRNVPGPFVAMRRGTLDQILVNGATRSGVDFVPSARLLHFETRPSVQASVAFQGDRHLVRTRYLVGADGRNSVVASATAGSMPVSAPRRIGLQWFTPHQPAIQDEVLIAAFAYGYLGAVNVDEATANIAMVIDPPSTVNAATALPELIRSVARSSPALGRFISDSAPTSPARFAYPINPRRLRVKSKTVFLAGDAHRTSEPMTGEGILFAISDGIAVAGNILAREGKRSPFPGVPRSRVVANQIGSRLLRHPGVMNATVALLANLPGPFAAVVRLIQRPV